MSMRPFLLLALVALAACSPKQADPLPPPPPAKISAFTVTPTTVATPGDPVTISWTTQDATSVSLEQVGVGPVTGGTSTSGEASATVAANTAFVLTARGEGGTDARSIGVTVQSTAQGVLFAALPERIEAGGSATLTWHAPGAQTIALEEVNGSPIDLRGQGSSGAVVVAPELTSRYRLTVDGESHEVTVTVTPVIEAFVLDGAPPLAGGPVTVAWITRGATAVSLTRADLSTPLLDETEPAEVASGDFTDTVPASLPAGGVLSYTLTASVGTDRVTQPLVIRTGGTLRFTLTNIPAYGRSGAVVPVSWQTAGADQVRVEVAGQSVFVTSSAAEVLTGNAVVDIGPSPVTVTLVATNQGGERAEVQGVVEAVGGLSFNSFTASPSTVATSGSEVTLAWDVPNARRVRLVQVGGGVALEREGLLDTGTVTVRPNRPSVTYRLEADNQAGESITPQTATVTVTTPAVVSASRRLPAGNQVQATGTTLAGATAISGLPRVETNAQGTAFVDISSSGTEVVGFATTAGVANTDDGTALLSLPGMDLRIFGRAVDATAVSVSTNGWFVFSRGNDAVAIPAVPVTTNLQPLSIVPFGRDLQLGPQSRVHWRQDTVSGVERLILQWTHVQAKGIDNSDLTFQAQVYATGELVFAYQAIQNVPTTFSAGVVNGDETAYLSAPTLPATGDTLRFFGAVPVSALPVSYVVMPAPAYVSVAVGGGARVEALLDDVLILGDLAVTEVNPRPALGLANAEWIELANFTPAPIDLSSWSMVAGASSYTFPAGVSVPAGGRLLLAQAADLGNGAAVTVGHLYPSSFLLPDASGQLALRPPGSTLAFARLDWTATTAVANGRAVQADRPSTSLRTASPFTAPTCPVATTTTYGTPAQQGTPGAAQGRCFPYVLESLPAGGFESLMATGTQIVAAANLTSVQTFQLTLPQPVRYFGNASAAVSVCSAGWLSTTGTLNTSVSNQATPSTAQPVGEIAPFWDSLAADSSQSGHGMYWLQRDPDGTPDSGDEVTIVSWEGWRPNMASVVNQYLDFQVKFRGNGDIEFHYGRQVGSDPLIQGSSATSWLESPAGDAALALNVNSATAPGIRGGTSFLFRHLP